jgi:hypothetical protein
MVRFLIMHQELIFKSDSILMSIFGLIFQMEKKNILNFVNIINCNIITHFTT